MISITQPTTDVKAALVIATLSTVTTALNSNNNVFWVPGGNVAMRDALTPTYYPTLASWQNASGDDANSFSTDPQFSSILTPVPTNLAINNAGVVIPGITLDVLGIVRGSFPDIGAYEFLPAAINELKAKNMLSCYPNPATNKASIKLPSGVLISSATIYNDIGEIMQLTIIAGKDDVVQLDIKNLKAGIYTIRFSNTTNNYFARLMKD